MFGQAERACLAIADISGYTGYLAGVELDHAQDILADLISVVVEAMAPFRLAKLEGDAAFSYVLADAIDGSLLQDTIEGTYVAFRRRLRDIKQASHCECNACILIPRLDIKFVVHHGTVIRQRIAGWEELVGTDVIVVHRLLKNRVVAETGIAAYALYTQAAVEAGSIDPRAQGLREHHEETDVAGEMVTWVRDLEQVWAALSERPRTEIRPDLVVRSWVHELPVPPQVAWDYVTSPVRRPQWSEGIDAVIEDSPGGRRGEGTTNHCMHGRDAVIEETVEWRPPEYWLTRSTVPFVPGSPQLTMSDELICLPGGRTRLIQTVGRPEDVDGQVFEAGFAPFEPMFAKAAADLGAALAEEARRLADADAPPIALPVNLGRHLEGSVAAVPPAR